MRMNLTKLPKINIGVVNDNAYSKIEGPKTLSPKISGQTPPASQSNTPSSCKVAAFVDSRSAAVKKCFIKDDFSSDGKEIFHEFLEKKYKQNSVRSIDLDLEKLVDFGIIDGAHTLKLCWDMFVGLMIVYSAVAVPYRLGFAIDSTGGWAVVDYTVDDMF